MVQFRVYAHDKPPACGSWQASTSIQPIWPWGGQPRVQHRSAVLMSVSPHFPAHEEDRLCLPTGSVGPILGKVTSTTDYQNTINQTKQNKTKSTFWLAVHLPFLVAVHPPFRPAGVGSTPTVSAGKYFAKSGCGTTKKMVIFHIGDPPHPPTSVQDIKRCRLGATKQPTATPS